MPVDQSPWLFENCTFEGGRGIRIDLTRNRLTSNPLSLRHCSFRNTAGVYFYLWSLGQLENSPITLYDCEFRNSSSHALYFELWKSTSTDSPISIKACHFENSPKTAVNLRYEAVGSSPTVSARCPIMIDNSYFFKNAGGVRIQYTGGQGSVPCRPDASPVSISNCIFESNNASSATLVYGSRCCTGGAVDINYGGTAYFPPLNSPALFQNCSFVDNTGRSKGGAVSLYQPGAIDCSVSLRNCTFERNAVSGSDASGGGISVDFGGVSPPNSADPGSFVMEHCNFLSNSVAGEQSADGGGLYLSYPPLTNPTTNVSIRNSQFRNNSVLGGGLANGGGAYIDIPSSSVFSLPRAVHVSATRFISNVAQAQIRKNTDGSGGSGGSGSGGLYFLSTSGVDFSVADSRFVRNEAGTFGGGLVALQKADNSPTNLLMKYIPETGSPTSESVPALCYDTVNSGNGSRVFREYDYASPPLVFSQTDFDSNRVGSAEDGSGSGGALHTVNFRVNISSCNVTLNTAGLTGGGIHLERGTGSLLIEGTASAPTNISMNSAQGGGGTVYAGNDGSVVVHGETTLTFTPGAAAITLVAAGQLKLGEGVNDGATVMQCGVGQDMLYNITLLNAQARDWKIDCGDFTVNLNSEPVFNYSNPTCLQLGAVRKCDKSAFAPANSCPSSCPGLPLFPITIFTIGTVSCQPCANGYYNLSRGQYRDGSVRPVTCSVCPFGGQCSGSDGTMGSGALAVKPNFWGHQVDVRQGESITSALTTFTDDAVEQRAIFMSCPPQFCCGNNSGCEWSDDVACVGNRDPGVPLCGACRSGYSFSITTGCIAD